MTDQRPDIDIEAERPDFEHNALARGLSVDRNDTGSYLMAVSEYRWRGWQDRARIAAERERSLLDLLADAQHAVCCYSCPEPREGEPDRHCETCVRIGEALTRKGPSDDEQGKWLWERLHCLEDLELAMQAEIERMRSIVAMMPTTADGVTITQGMTVYVLGYKDEPIEVVVEEMRLYEGGDWWLDGRDVYPAWQPQNCYSTLEAARKGPTNER